MGRTWSRKGWEMMCVISFVFSFLSFFPYYYFLFRFGDNPQFRVYRADHVISLDLPVSGQRSPNWAKRHLPWAKIRISLTKISLLWRATPPTTIIFNSALF